MRRRPLLDNPGSVYDRVQCVVYQEVLINFIPNRFIIEHPVIKLSEHSAWCHDMSIQIGKFVHDRYRPSDEAISLTDQ